MSLLNWFISRAIPTKRRQNGKRRARNQERLRFEGLEQRQVFSATLWVDPGSSSDYDTIQDAVDDARPGDTIKVAAGYKFEESVVVDKSLTILGGQRHRTGQSGATTVKSDSAAFTLLANNVTIKSFTIEQLNQPARGIVTDAAFSGYQILNNIFADELYGIELHSATDAAAKKSTISGNVFKDTDKGIYSNSGVRNAAITNNSFDGSIDGISLARATRVTISKNTITNSDEDGIELRDGSTLNTISDNHCTKNGLNGILLEKANQNSVSGNRTNGNFDRGIRLDDADENTVSGNTANDNGKDGMGTGIVLLNNSDKNTIRSNTTKNNEGDGIEASADSDQLAILKNVANNNGAIGIATAGVMINLSGNTANSNHGKGIIVGGDKSTISDNVANSNGSDGLFLGGKQLVISNNKAAFNKADGIFFSGTNSSVSGNTVSRNERNGINLDENTANNVVKKNTALVNGKYDLNDDSIGPGTAGTKNTYSQNIALKRNPRGLR